MIQIPIQKRRIPEVTLEGGLFRCPRMALPVGPLNSTFDTNHCRKPMIAEDRLGRDVFLARLPEVTLGRGLPCGPPGGPGDRTLHSTFDTNPCRKPKIAGDRLGRDVFLPDFCSNWPYLSIYTHRHRTQLYGRGYVSAGGWGGQTTFV